MMSGARALVSLVLLATTGCGMISGVGDLVIGDASVGETSTASDASQDTNVPDASPVVCTGNTFACPASPRGCCNADQQCKTSGAVADRGCCTPKGVSCAAGTCCKGLVCSDAGVCSTSAACLANGSTCTNDGQCCSGTCSGTCQP